MPAPVLSPELAEQLSRVPTSHDQFVEYAPCLVRLKSGEVLPRVYLAEESAYVSMWGTDPARPVLPLDEIASIEDSPSRLPAPLANAVYQAGESGMGYFVFKVRMRDGSSIPFLTGDAVDFPDWPTDINPSHAVSVKPHAGRRHFRSEGGAGRRSADFVFCLYNAP